ncbi:hypothetical protein [Streptomyces sp. NPDC002343]
MSAPVPRSRRRRFLAPGTPAPRRPVDQAKVGRRSVRRRAAGMTVTEVAAALEADPAATHALAAWLGHRLVPSGPAGAGGAR